MGDAPELPWICALPYLPVREPVEFAGWWLGPVTAFAGPWRDPQFHDAVGEFLDSFRTASGQPVKKPALLVRRETGANGVAPTLAEFHALELAIGLATIDANAFWSPENEQDGYRIATADNADLWVQSIDVEHRRITLERGLRVRTIAGGHRIGTDDFFIPAPLELHLPSGVGLDADVLEAVYRTALEQGDEPRAEAVLVAIRWLLKTWLNSTSVSIEDRIVLLKIASEALTGKDKTHEGGAQLVALFASAGEQPGEGIGTDGLLWQPDERRLKRVWSNRSGEKSHSELTLLEHWYGALGDARNKIVHEGGASSLVYEEDSPYAGPFVEIGDRVIREAITVELGNLGYPAVWRRGLTRASFRMWERLSAGDVE
ncbi:MAG: hypothetical protein U0W40_13630 [Acidimicrobiia bacterium]